MAWWKFWGKLETKITLIDYARTNYIIAKLRLFLDLDIERYVKWYYGGSFNGIGLSLTTETFASINCYKNAVKSYYGAEKPTQLGDIFIIVDSTDKIETENFIKRANKDFDNLLEIQGDKILSQVKRLMMSITYQDFGIKSEVENFIDSIKNEFPKSKVHKFGGNFPPIEGLDLSSYMFFDFDVEIILDEILDKKIVIDKLRNHIPNLNESIYGFGCLSHYGNIENLPIHIHLYARQF